MPFFPGNLGVPYPSFACGGGARRLSGLAQHQGQRQLRSRGSPRAPRGPSPPPGERLLPGTTQLRRPPRSAGEIPRGAPRGGVVVGEITPLLGHLAVATYLKSWG